MDYKKDDNSESLAFNIAKEYAYKIGEHLEDFDKYWSVGNLRKSLWSLKSVWHKFQAFCEVEEYATMEKKFVKLQQLFLKKESKHIINKDLEHLYFLLVQKLNNKGLLIPVASDPKFMFRKDG